MRRPFNNTHVLVGLSLHQKIHGSIDSSLRWAVIIAYEYLTATGAGYQHSGKRSFGSPMEHLPRKSDLDITDTSAPNRCGNTKEFEVGTFEPSRLSNPEIDNDLRSRR
jgi:hypothetical protein